MTNSNHDHHAQGKDLSTDLTKGPILNQLWSLAWPMMLSVFFYTLYNLVDAYWVSKISPQAIAAVGISQVTLMITMSIGFGITVGSGVIMSMNIGAKNHKEAERILGQSFVLAILLGIFFTILSLTFRNDLLTASGATGAIFEPAKEYFNIVAGGSVLLFLLINIMFAFNAQGDTNTLTKLFALSTLVNLVLDPIMIFGWLGFPAMGIAGAAVATLISQLVFIVIAIRSLGGKHRSIRFHFSNLTFKWESVKAVLKIGLPAALTQVIYPVGLAALTYLTALRFLEPGTIALSLGLRVEFFAFLPAVGFGFAAMAMIGQNLGAGNLNRAKEVLSKALKYGFCAAAGLGVLVAIFAVPIVHAFTTDPQVVKDTVSYLRIVALLSYGLLALAMIEANAFQALGKSWPGFWIFFLRFVVITLPLTYILTSVLDYPIIAVWISIVIGSLISAVIGYFWIRNHMTKKDLEQVPVHA